VLTPTGAIYPIALKKEERKKEKKREKERKKERKK
jgi:hypothetical protein